MKCVLSVGVEVLDRLDRLIEKYSLHARGAEPVDPSPLLEEFKTSYGDLPPDVEAALVRWRAHGHTFTRLLYHPDLREPSHTARRRYAGAHELAHAICEHRGDLYMMWRAGGPPDEGVLCPRRRRGHASGPRARSLLLPVAALRAEAGLDAPHAGRALA